MPASINVVHECGSGNFQILEGALTGKIGAGGGYRPTASADEEAGQIVIGHPDGDGIAIRHCAFGEGNDYIREVASHASIPVLSMQCDIYHPCQILADILTIKEKFHGKIAVAGGVNSAVTLETGSSRAINRQVRDACNELGRDGGLILAPVDSLFPSTPWGNSVSIAG